MRVAFLTSEYPTDLPDAGGLATYVRRMALALRNCGHEPEVFTSTVGQSDTQLDQGICVHRVNIAQTSSLVTRWVADISILFRSHLLTQTIPLVLQAHALAAALERRHAEAPFQLVQSADYQAVGLFVRRRYDRFYVVRCSTATDLYSAIDHASSRSERLRGYLERRIMRTADFSYCPSNFLADYFRRTFKLNVGVIRPPLPFEATEDVYIPFELPKRFFLHFGLLLDRKGTGLVAQALPIVWRTAPDLMMVWSGRCYDYEKLRYWQSLWGLNASQVLITGPLPRAQMRAVLARADAAVLPSQADNLPNTVIESLSLGIPVLGSRGASIDELVEENRHGHLVALSDAKGLADAMIRMWRRETPVKAGFRWDTKTAQEMQPERAVANLVGLASRHAPSWSKGCASRRRGRANA
jgi:glycogen synthase